MSQSSTTPAGSIEFACPECEAAVPYSSRNNAPPLIGEIISCPDCAVELEVVSVSPPSLAVAPEVQEDWGE